MWKTVLAGTTALAIAGASLAYADQGSPRGDQAQRWRPSASDIAAFSDARIAALHAGLKLNADQEKHWPAVETAMRDMAKERADRFAARQNAQRTTDPIERMSQRADAMEQRGAALKKLAVAAGPLYSSLDEAQKHRFMRLARAGFERRFARWHGHRHGQGFGDFRRGGPPEGGPPQGGQRPQ
jgi:zinc resistance-associated protein